MWTGFCIHWYREGYYREKSTEARIKESEERYRVLVESSPEPIMVFCDYQITFVNPAVVALIGAANPEELIGEHVARFLHPDDMSRLREELEQLFVSNQALRCSRKG